MSTYGKGNSTKEPQELGSRGAIRRCSAAATVVAQAWHYWRRGNMLFSPWLHRKLPRASERLCTSLLYASVGVVELFK